MGRAILYIFLVSFLTINCRKESSKCHDSSNPNCDNYNPCAGKQPVSADFTIGCYLGNFTFDHYDFDYIEDSIFVQQSEFNSLKLLFKAKETNAKYTWYLGSEIINDSVFVRDFSRVPYGKYTIKLIVDKNPNLLCHPTDDGLDTLIKSFFIIPVYQAQFIGQFKVLIEGELDSTVVQIQPWKTSLNTILPLIDSFSKNEFTFLNFANNNDTTSSDKVLLSTFATNSKMYFIKDFYFPNGPSRLTLGSGNIQIKNKNKIEANYEYAKRKWIFKGRKL